MTFKKIFDNMCKCYFFKPARFFSVSADTFNKITARKLMNNCLESDNQVVLSDYADYGNAKVADFYAHMTESESDPCNGHGFHEQNFTMVFIKD